MSTLESNSRAGTTGKFEDIPVWDPPTPPDRDMPTLDDILSIIGQWGIDNYLTIREVYWQKGGWEGWAQVELALLFTQQYKKTNTFREELVYWGNNRRADLTLELQGEKTQVIELKMESLFQDQAPGGVTSFITKMKEDILKIDTYNLKPEYRPALVYAIGFSCRDEVNEYCLDGNNWQPYKNDVDYKLLVPSTDDHPALFMWFVSLNRTTNPAKDQHPNKQQ
ncbi:hypothetical protein PMIN06_010258 [Paraphaeosphaeria minitans]